MVNGVGSRGIFWHLHCSGPIRPLHPRPWPKSPPTPTVICNPKSSSLYGRRVHRVVKWDLGHKDTLRPWQSQSRPAPLGHRCTVGCRRCRGCGRCCKDALREELEKRFLEFVRSEPSGRTCALKSMHAVHERRREMLTHPSYVVANTERTDSSKP